MSIGLWLFSGHGTIMNRKLLTKRVLWVQRGGFWEVDIYMGRALAGRFVRFSEIPWC